MLQIDNVQLVEGVTVYGDDQAFNTFYLLPQQPRFRRDDNGVPVFKFIKYKFPVDRQDGKKGGGFIIFDAEFVVPEDKLAKITQFLQRQVSEDAVRRGVGDPGLKLGTITYTSGETLINIERFPGELVEKVFNPGTPSLFGNNITTFSVELSPEGATLFESALQGKGGVVSVVYKMKFWAKLPPMKVHAWFNSSQFYSFFQTIDVEWSFWGEDDYRETVRERLIQSQSMDVFVDPGGVTDEKLKGQVRDWAFRTLEARIEKLMIQSITPVPEDQRKIPDGIENVTRDISSTKISSIDLRYTESPTVEWFVAPQGTLPNITGLVDKQGKAFKWEDFATVVDLDDPFFRQLRVDTLVNADFQNLPIHSVEVKVRYSGRPMANMTPNQPEGEVVMRKADDIGHFGAFVEGDNWKYRYSYQVNYKGTSQVFQSEEIETDEGNLTIGVDDVGILTVKVSAGDLNWQEVESTQVRLTYEDPGEGVGPLEDQFVLTKDHPTHLFQEVIFKPFRKSYKYAVTYRMKDGKELRSGELEGRAKDLFINDPFSGIKTVKVIAAGDLKNTIENVFVDLKYEDRQNDYVQQKSIALNSATPFQDWVFPVISEMLGTVTVSGNVVLKSGAVKPIPARTEVSGTIIVPRPPVGFLEVTVASDLLDFNTCILTLVSLTYEDPENMVSERSDVRFSAAKKESPPWKVPIFDASKNQYTWEATYFMKDNTQRKTTPVRSSVTTLVVPAP